MERYGNPVEITEDVPSLCSRSTLSQDSHIFASPTPSTKDASSVQGESLGQYYAKFVQQRALVNPRRTNSSESLGDLWSDFLVPDYLHSSETIRDPCPDVLSDDRVGVDPVGFDGIYTNEIMEAFDRETGNTGFATRTTFFDQQGLSVFDIPKTDFKNHGPRFIHKLDAPAAVFRESKGSAVTYLNKGAHYSLLVEDTLHLGQKSGNVLYCTTIQVAFDSESRREQPLASWRLWDQNRGADEGHLFERRFQAIEYLGSHNSDSSQYMSNIQVVHSDGFSLVWSADGNLQKHCSIQFQLNFLSTDFSHAKGVHGSTMRLCAKTEEVSTVSLRFPATDPGINYCRIQIFRSHGAERKTSNETAAIAERIARLTQKLQSSQLSSYKKNDIGEGKSKRIRNLGKVKEDALRSRREELQSRCTTSQRYSILDQQGEKQRHCDWYPEKCGSSEKGRQDSNQLRSPSGNSASMALTEEIMTRLMRSPVYSSRSISEKSGHATAKAASQWSLDDSSMQEKDARVACFYARSVDCERYRPIYLSERSANEFTRRVAAAVSIDATKVLRSIWLNDRGFNIMIDDDVVQNMKEGQGMLVTVTNVSIDLFEIELEF